MQSKRTVSTTYPEERHIPDILSDMSLKIDEFNEKLDVIGAVAEGAAETLEVVLQKVRVLKASATSSDSPLLPPYSPSLPPPRPQVHILQPSENDISVPVDDLYFEWEATPDALHYRVVLRDLTVTSANSVNRSESDEDLGKLIDEPYVQETYFTVPAHLLAGREGNDFNFAVQVFTAENTGWGVRRFSVTTTPTVLPTEMHTMPIEIHTQPIEMKMSEEGLAMLRDFEFTVSDARRGLGDFDEQNRWVGIYPHYVFVRNRNTGDWQSDGGITFGFGVWITESLFNQQAWARELINKYAPGASFVPPHIPQNGASFRVPGSFAMPLEEARELFRIRVPRYSDAVNRFLIQHHLIIEQHQFDALVSLTFNFGPGIWTRINPETNDLLWHLVRYIRDSQPYDPEKIYYHFTSNQQPRRRGVEANVFNHGHS